MRKIWIFVVLCLLVLISLSEAGDKGKAKKKSKAQIEKDKLKKGTKATTESTLKTTREHAQTRKMGRLRREIPAAGDPMLGPYRAQKRNAY